MFHHCLCLFSVHLCWLHDFNQRHCTTLYRSVPWQSVGMAIEVKDENSNIIGEEVAVVSERVSAKNAGCVLRVHKFRSLWKIFDMGKYLCGVNGILCRMMYCSK